MTGMTEGDKREQMEKGSEEEERGGKKERDGRRREAEARDGRALDRPVPLEG